MFDDIFPLLVMEHEEKVKNQNLECIIMELVNKAEITGSVNHSDFIDICNCYGINANSLTSSEIYEIESEVNHRLNDKAC